MRALAPALLLGLLALPFTRSAGPSCAVNTSYFPPLTCPDDYTCCKMPTQVVCADEAPPCTTCPFCCHSYLNATECAACNAEQCKGHSTVGDAGCNTTRPASWVPWGGGSACCGRGLPLPQSRALPNCLLVGDSTCAGQAALVASALKDECQVQYIEAVNSDYEALCWGTHNVATDGTPVYFDVIHYNEGLHSLYPRTNVTGPTGAAFAASLANWTRVLAAPRGGLTPTLIYATMTPMMAQHYCSPPGPPQTSVEDINALAVATVRAAGVTRIDDAYAAITSVCGPLYKNCSLCDNEQANFPGCAAYSAPAPNGGICGFHFSSRGWETLANNTVRALRGVLAERRAAAAAAAAAAAVPYTLTLRAGAPLARTDPARFASFSFDTTALFGVQRTAIPCAHPKLRALARNLAPAFLRVGGSLQDRTVAAFPGVPQPPPAPPTMLALQLNASTFDGVLDFADATGLDLVYGLNAAVGRQTASGGGGAWDADNALAPVRRAAALGLRLPVVEL